MPTILIASLDPGAGRTAVAAALSSVLAREGRSVRLLRIRSPDDSDSAAEDDARTLAAVPGCTAHRRAVNEQEAQAQAADADSSGAVTLVEAPAAGPAEELARRLSARAVLVSQYADAQHLSGLKAAGESMREALLGVIVTRQPERRLASVRTAIEERGLVCLGVLPEDRLLAGPTLRELGEALQATTLVGEGEEDEGLEYVMLGPISSDPGQPYFLQHGSKAVINRSDKMDLHLAALATEPEALILTGGRELHPYLIDRVVGGSGVEVTVLLTPEPTPRAMQALDDLYTRTRFIGSRKLDRVVELFRQHAEIATLLAAAR